MSSWIFLRNSKSGGALSDLIMAAKLTVHFPEINHREPLSRSVAA
jgi:hypothetical protein